MFLKNSSYDEFAAELEKGLQKAEQAPLVEKQTQQKKAIKHLLVAAELFDEVGLEKQAHHITSILERFAWEVPKTDSATSGLTPEKMVSNLENKGWVFNDTDDGQDGEIIDVVDPEPGDSISMEPDGELEVTDTNTVDDMGNVSTTPEGMAINPMNPINSGGMSSLAGLSTWPRDGGDPYGEEQIDLDLRHLLKKK